MKKKALFYAGFRVSQLSNEIMESQEKFRERVLSL